MSVWLSSCRTYINLLSDSESGSEHDSYEDRNVQQASEASLHDFRYILTFSFHLVVLYVCFRAVNEGDDELATSSDVKSVLVNHFSQLHLSTDANEALLCVANTSGDTLSVHFHVPLSIAESQCM